MLKILDTMTWVLWLLLVVCALWAAATMAQEDVLLLPNPDGTYPVGCQDQGSDEVRQACWQRVDTATPEDLACMSIEIGGTAAANVTLTTTPNQDAHIKCFASDRAGNASGLSPNDGIVDFTPPLVPLIVP
jgi:hypothetical protein